MVGCSRGCSRQGNQAQESEMAEMRRMIEDLLQECKNYNDENMWMPVW